MAIEQGSGASTAYATQRYAPRTVAQGSSAQVSWITDMVREIHKLQVRNLQIMEMPVTAADLATAIEALGTADKAVSATLTQPLINGEHGTIPRIKATLQRTRAMNREMERKAAQRFSVASTLTSIPAEIA